MSDAIKVRCSTADDWAVIETLMGPQGVGGGCWCQWGIVPHGGKQWRSCQGEPNRRAFRREIEAGEVFGSLAFAGGECVGWCRYGPWSQFPRLANSPSLNRNPPPGTWSIVCFYIPARWRKRGVGSALLGHAVGRMKGREEVAMIEAYPVPANSFSGSKVPAAFAWTGIVPMFERLGFRPCSKTGVKRQVYRLG
ncbi:MAG: GNAT family N-acetyltransferase [Xanthomonadales bacterium]|nr:GNAT family N-acetyltransferase [Xanthomonadales bacterium]